MKAHLCLPFLLVFERMYDKWLAYALWLSLGYLGAHRFYLNMRASGFVWFITLGLFGIGWVVDAFMLPQLVALWREFKPR